MRKFWILLIQCPILLLTGCSSSSQITGELTVQYVSSFLPCEPQNLPVVGSVSNGAGEILGSVSIIEFLRESRSGNANSRSCIYYFASTKVNLKQEVLVIEFGGDQRWSGRWILNQAQYEDGVVNLRT
jgi:hypothetical protein